MPVRRGGVILRMYEHSLLIALVLLFFLSFGVHLVGSTREHCRDQLMHGQSCPDIWQHASGATFWFESFQNWQSEFLSIALMVWLAVYLRQRGSPESKPVYAPHHETGR